MLTFAETKEIVTDCSFYFGLIKIYFADAKKETVPGKNPDTVLGLKVGNKGLIGCFGFLGEALQLI